MCKRQGIGGGNYCLTIKGGHLILALSNVNDSYQYWYKESTNGGFMIVNRRSDVCIKYCGVGDYLLVVGKPSRPESCLVWTESRDLTSGHGYIRSRDNSNNVIDAYTNWTGIVSHGLRVSIYSQKNSNTQLWKLVRGCKSLLI
ncbi:hypothetical protein vseg_017306 [Gypsophila vaccaria]